MSYSHTDQGYGLWPGLLVGGVVGFALGILLAPRRGAETREQLIEQAGDVMNQGMGAQVASVREVIQEGRDILREVLAEGKEVLKEAMEEGRHASARTEAELRREYEQATGHEPETGHPS